MHIQINEEKIGGKKTHGSQSQTLWYYCLENTWSFWWWHQIWWIRSKKKEKKPLLQWDTIKCLPSLRWFFISLISFFSPSIKSNSFFFPLENYFPPQTLQTSVQDSVEDQPRGFTATKGSYQKESCCRNPSVNWDPAPCGLPGLWNILERNRVCFSFSKVTEKTPGTYGCFWARMI